MWYCNGRLPGKIVQPIPCSKAAADIVLTSRMADSLVDGSKCPSPADSSSLRDDTRMDSPPTVHSLSCMDTEEVSMSRRSL